jgi:hypothetical protein
MGQLGKKSVARMVFAGTYGLLVLLANAISLVRPPDLSQLTIVHQIYSSSFDRWFRIGCFLEVLGAGLLVTGVVLTALDRMKGPSLVRASCKITIAWMMMGTAAIMYPVLTAPLTPGVRSVFLLEFSVAFTITVGVWGFIWFLFRTTPMGDRPRPAR